MAGSDWNEYCAFTKAVEHIADRWCFLILRELAMSGPQGFNALAEGVPGHISRSVLTDRLQRLTEVGLIGRAAPDARAAERRQRPFCLTPSGEGFTPTLLAMRDWADTYLPEDPAMAERDPDILVAWLGQRLDGAMLPEQQVVVEVRYPGEREHRWWLVLQRGEEPFGCREDPLLDPARYVYVETDAAALVRLARGQEPWTHARAAGSVRLFGDPRLTAALPGWFRPVDVAPPGSSPRPAMATPAAT